MVDLTLFSPEVEALVREYAADPRSCLLRVPRGRAVPGVLDTARPVSARATGLGALERELLRVHRCALAKLLREACILRLYDHPDARLHLIRHQTVDGRTHVPERDDWRRRAELGLDDARADGVETEWLELLERCVAPDGPGQASVQQLAAASMRLEPTDQARIYTGQALYQEGEVETACRIFRGVAETSASATNVGWAYANLGLAHVVRGDFDRACDSYERASARAESNFVAHALVFATSLYAANTTRIESAAARVDAVASPNDACVTDVVDSFRAQRNKGRFAPSLETRMIWRAVADSLGPTTRVIANEIV